MFEVRHIQNPSEWDTFMSKREFVPFTQSSIYGEFAKTLDEHSWLFGIYDQSGALSGGAVVIGVRAKRGSYLIMHYGPTFAEFDHAHLKAFTNVLADFGRLNSYDFIRMSPFIPDTDKNRNICREAGYRPAPIHIIAENTLLLRLDQTEASLLKQMNKNHRNLIKRCEREGVTVSMRTDEEALARLNDMHDVVSKEHHFHRFSRRFISNEFRLFSEKGHAVIFEATLPDGRVDASSVIMFYGNMACYRHSASLKLDKRLPTSYLIQWHAIKEAKKRGLLWYNFWGIAPEDANKRHPFWGLRHFKRGFGGEQMDLLHCYDMPLGSRYYAVWLIEKIRSLKRGFK